MPPKAKFEKEKILDAAIAVIEREGIDALTARSLGRELGSSARPVFTVFDGMDAVMRAVFSRAEEIYGSYVEEGLRETLAFRGVGKAYIRFAAERPRLFQMLFMRERGEVPDKDAVLKGIEGHYDEIVDSIVGHYAVDRQTAVDLYLHLWVYSHGIAVLLATKMCAFSQEQISDMLTVVFVALLQEEKARQTTC